MLSYEFCNKIRGAFKSNSASVLKKLAAMLIEDLKGTDLLSDRTFYHPLGFIYNRLYEFSPNETLRLHIWDTLRKTQKPLMDIHDHFYELSSFVVKGEIKNSVFAVRKIEPSTHCVYVGSYSPNGNRMLQKTEDTVNISLLATTVVEENTLYEIPRGTYHSSSVQNNLLTCTLVYTSNPGEPSPIVFGPIEGQSQYTYPIETVSTSEIRRILHALTMH